MRPVTFSAISAAGGPDRINEDGWAAVETAKPPGWFSAAVIDGASVRGVLPSLAAYVERQGYGGSSAAWATSVVRGAICQAFTNGALASPRDALLTANRALRTALEAVPGMAEVYALMERQSAEPLLDGIEGCTASLRDELRQAFEALFPDGAWYRLDTRYLRLVLPACVATLVRSNLSSGKFDFAHAGDTALALAVSGGGFSLLSEDQMQVFDRVVIEIGLAAARQRDEIRNLAEAVQVMPDIRELNLLNGVRHNYVDEDGHTQPGEGCGVVNGLASLSDYVQTGDQVLSRGSRLYLMSDGIMLPLSSHSDDLSPSMRASVAGWCQALEEGDVSAMLRHARLIAGEDASRDAFPRLKDRDDATVLMMAVEA